MARRAMRRTLGLGVFAGVLSVTGGAWAAVGDELVAEAAARAKAGEPEAAAGLYARALAVDAGRAAARVGLAAALEAAGKRAECVAVASVCRTTVKDKAKAAACALHEGRCRAGMDDAGGARAALQAALTLVPGHAEAEKALARLSAAETGPAERAARAWLTAHCKGAPITAERGALRCSGGDVDLAVEGRIIGAFTAQGRTEALLQVRDGERSHAEGFGYSVLMRRDGEAWQAVARLADLPPGDGAAFFGTVRDAAGRDRLVHQWMAGNFGLFVGAVEVTQVDEGAIRSQRIVELADSEGGDGDEVVSFVASVSIVDVNGDGWTDLRVRLNTASGTRERGKAEAPVDWRTRATHRAVFRFDGKRFTADRALPRPPDL